MKIEIDISEKLFRRAEETAKKLKISRKQLFTKAIRIYVENHKFDSKDVTAKLSEFYSGTDISFESTWE